MNAIVFWVAAGSLYAANTWHLLWLPAIWILFPGVLLAHGIALVFDIPAMSIADRAVEEAEVQGSKRWDLVAVSAALKVGELAGAAVGAVLYVEALKWFIA